MKKIAIVLMAILIILGCTACTDIRRIPMQLSDKVTRNTVRATQLARKTIENYVDENMYNGGIGDDSVTYVYGVYNPYDGSRELIASAWHYTAVVAMTNRLYAINRDNDHGEYFLKYNADLIRDLAYYRGTDEISTYNGTKEWSMYAVNRAQRMNRAKIRGKAAVYDDQMWLIREHISAYENTGKAEYLKEAEYLTAVCLDGWDTTKDENGNEYGGITWGAGYSSKHTCSNAPIVAPLVKLSNMYKDKTDKIGDTLKSEYYLDWAKKVYNFSYAEFRNPDGTYGDMMDTDRIYDETAQKYVTTNPHKNFDSKAYTYNTGAMISGAAELYGATNEKIYLDQAKNAAAAAFDVFGDRSIKNGYVLYPITSSTIWFNLVLLQGYIDLYPYDKTESLKYIDSYQKTLDYAYDNYYFNGCLPRDFLNGWVYGSSYDENKDVMDSATVAEMFGMLAEFESKIK